MSAFKISLIVLIVVVLASSLPTSRNDEVGSDIFQFKRNTNEEFVVSFYIMFDAASIPSFSLSVVVFVNSSEEPPDSMERRWILTLLFSSLVNEELWKMICSMPTMMIRFLVLSSIPIPTKPTDRSARDVSATSPCIKLIFSAFL